MGQPLYCSAVDVSMGRERLWWYLHPLCMTQQYCLASMAAWLSSTDISHHDLLPYIPSIRLSAINSSPHPGIAPQSKCQHPAPLVTSRGPSFLSGVFMVSSRTVWFSFHLGCHRSSVSLSALNVSPLTQTIAPMWGSDPCFSSPTCWGQVQSYWHSCFFPLVPSSYQVLLGGVYYFPLVRYSCLLSAGVLHALLCLKVYSWCICGKRCTSHPPTPPPSCSPLNILVFFLILEENLSAFHHWVWC